MTSSDPGLIRPFRVDVPQDQLDDLRRRLHATRWPDELPGAGDGSGVPVARVRALAERWRDGFDWRAAEARLGAVPQFTTEIDGQTIHFLHARSPEPDALPLVVTHGWPGSVVEYLDLVGPLTDPAAHGGDPADAFHVVVPSLPGFGFSGPTRESGWDVERIARAWTTLMARLGYDRYAAHGGDWGAAVSRAVGVADPEHVVGVHVTALFGAGVDADEADPSDERERRSADLSRRYRDELAGYSTQQSTRPTTLAYGLHDSPVGQLAWIADPFLLWTDPDTPVADDVLLTNVALYWFTGTAASSARLYKEEAATWGQEPPASTVPTALAVFPHDLGLPIRRRAERTNRIVRWTEFDRGGHFAALEVPDLLLADLRATFAGLR